MPGWCADVLPGNAGRKRMGDSAEVVGYQVSAIAVGPNAYQLDAGVARPQRLHESAQRVQRCARRGVHAKPTRQTNAGGFQSFAAHQSPCMGNEVMARIVF